VGKWCIRELCSRKWRRKDCTSGTSSRRSNAHCIPERIPAYTCQRWCGSCNLIEFSEIIEDTSSRYNIRAEEGDAIVIDRDPRVVYVRGEVAVPSAVVYEKGTSLKTYLKQSGGLKDGADEDRILWRFPTGKNGNPAGVSFPIPTSSPEAQFLFPRRSSTRVKPGSIIGSVTTTLVKPCSHYGCNCPDIRNNGFVVNSLWEAAKSK